MLKRIDKILNILSGSLIGVFIGHGIYVYRDYQTHYDLYVIQSAPWYTSILLYGMVTITFLIVAIIVKLVIRKKIE